jgi:DNA-binding beta-propeller fold protein YncE
MARSLGSVYGGAVTRFLGGGCRGIARRVIDTPGVRSWSNGLAVSRDGGMLLVSNSAGRARALALFDVSDGSQRRVIGEAGDGRLQFDVPHQVWVASDGFVFVAEYGNDRVQVLTPRLRFHGFVRRLKCPSGVCANADVVVVSELGTGGLITVFSRADFTVVRRFGCGGTGDGQLHGPLGLCFMCDDRHVAIADSNNRRVSVFSVDGDFVRHVGVGVLKWPMGVACTADDELVVADYGNRCIVVFSASGETMQMFGSGRFTGVAVHGSTIFAQDYDSEKCVVFE